MSDETPLTDEDWRRKWKAFSKLPPSGTDFADFTEADWKNMKEIQNGMTPRHFE